MRYSLISLLACLFLFSCPSRSIPQNEVKDESNELLSEETMKDCTIDVLVKDYKGMDGCRFLFVLNNGEKLLPNEMPVMDFKLANNQAVKIDYNVIKDAVSACMMESQIIKVNCITLVGQTGGVKPIKQPCVKTDNYADSKWLKSIAKDMKPYIVTRFTYQTDGWAYLLDSGTQRKLIDCQGNVICTARGKAMSDCTKKIKNLGEGIVIHATKPPRN